ncbi:hypothetical protein [Bacillus sp. LK2]|uniref:hypothetical protein n=1 Tax=Bacillus sp. LK2 TaxID=1628206 RepID=UPI000654A81E|nr:hypothetical protein [Bacillus sp. LK2]KMN42337.1 hypothetical protein VK90_24725 [Bacillus sp. LK2]
MKKQSINALTKLIMNARNEGMSEEEFNRLHKEWKEMQKEQGKYFAKLPEETFSNMRFNAMNHSKHVTGMDRLIKEYGKDGVKQMFMMSLNAPSNTVLMF